MNVPMATTNAVGMKRDLLIRDLPVSAGTGLTLGEAVGEVKAACHFTGSSGIGDMPGAGPILADGVWHQIVCWKTLNQVRLFVDGTVAASRSVTGFAPCFPPTQTREHEIEVLG